MTSSLTAGAKLFSFLFFTRKLKADLTVYNWLLYTYPFPSSCLYCCVNGVHIRIFCRASCGYEQSFSGRTQWIKAPIHCLCQSCNPISCWGQPVERTSEIGLEMISSVRSAGFLYLLVGSHDWVRKWMGTLRVSITSDVLYFLYNWALCKWGQSAGCCVNEDSLLGVV